MVPLSTYALSSQAISSLLSMPDICRVDPFPWPLPRVYTCHFPLALLCAYCSRTWLSIYYWSLDPPPPVCTSLCRLSPTNTRAIHLSNADSQLLPWTDFPTRPRFPHSYSSALSAVCDRAGPGTLGASLVLIPMVDADGSWGTDVPSCWQNTDEVITGSCGVCVPPLRLVDSEAGPHVYEAERPRFYSYSLKPSRFSAWQPDIQLAASTCLGHRSPLLLTLTGHGCWRIKASHLRPCAVLIQWLARVDV